MRIELREEYPRMNALVCEFREDNLGDRCLSLKMVPTEISECPSIYIGEDNPENLDILIEFLQQVRKEINHE